MNTIAKFSSKIQCANGQASQTGHIKTWGNVCFPMACEVTHPLEFGPCVLSGHHGQNLGPDRFLQKFWLGRTALDFHERFQYARTNR